ncbi:MAG: hypothetical protein HZA16_08305 [Nitrospirae bacterium]|nr:hypothetical protein [Nitrospirota bacterium]
MRGHRISLIAAACLLIHLVTGAVLNAGMKDIVWKEVSGGIRNSDLRRVAVGFDSQETVYVGSATSVYKTTDGGKTWEEILSLMGTGNTVTALVASEEGTVLAGTTGGLYRSGDSGIHWTRIFTGVGGPEDSVFSVAVDPGKPGVIFIGAGSGTYRTENNGKDWERGKGIPGTIVTSIAIAGQPARTLYAATETGLYKSADYGTGWQRILGVIAAVEENGALIEEKETDDEEAGAGARMRDVAVDPSDSSRIYLGTSKGLLISEDSGSSWKAAGEAGLLSREIRQITMSPGYADGIFASTEKGAFQYHRASDDWNEIYEGLGSDDVRALAFSPGLRHSHATLWAATGKGIYKTVPKIQPHSRGGDVDFQSVISRFDHEPTIEEIRAEAVAYAEVSPGKIEKWRKAAANKAWLPDLSFSYSKNRSWQKSTYFYSTKDEKYTDDDLTHDRDKDWSVSVTWELGDLIWNNDQTSIDSRSKLMVELRDDVLNEVTRLYFERRRVQIEMLLSPPEDIAERTNKELRLQELTAGIDALTGSCLSKRLAQQPVGLTKQ